MTKTLRNMTETHQTEKADDLQTQPEQMMMTELAAWLFLSLLCMFGTDRVQGRVRPLILSLGRPRCSCAGQCQVWFICIGNAQPL